jgi:hypothetical protein
MNPQIDLWYISCSTGCTCCSDQNFDQGFYKTEEAAQAQRIEWSNGNGNPLASQYARYGRYGVYKVVAELLPDGRMIVDNQVHPQDFFGEI